MQCPTLEMGNQPSGSAHPAGLLPTTQPGARPTVGPAVHVDLGPVIQSQQGEEGEDGGEDVLETVGVRLAEQSPEHDREEDWWFRAKPGSQGLPYPVPLPPVPAPIFHPSPTAQDTEASKHEDEDGRDGWHGPHQGPGHFLDAGQEAGAEVEREAESGVVGICAQEPELTLNTGVPDSLVTRKSPSPSLENEENEPAGG